MGTSHDIPTGIVLTTEELLRLPRGHARFELVAGELRVMEPGGAEHGRVAARAGLALGKHVLDHDLGETFGAETGFLIATDPDTVRAPDAAFLSRERVDRFGRVTGYWPEAPDLAIEVVSPGDSYTKVQEKALMWLEAGCRLVLLLEPGSATAIAYRRPGEGQALLRDDVVDCSDVVPGFAPRVAELLGL